MTAKPERVLRLEAALADAERKLKSNSSDVTALFEKARLLSLLGQDDAAKDSYVALLHRDSAHFGALTNLAALALVTGHRSAALTAYRRAAEQHPDNPTALVNLAGLLLEDGKHDEARGYFEAALKLEPAYAEADQGLARVFAALGDEEAAELHWQKGYLGHSVVTRDYRGRGNPPRVLVLVAARSGNIPTQLLLDDRIFAVTALYAGYHDPSAPLPQHDVVFNAIGDADLCGRELAAALKIAARSRAPVINKPEAVMPTGRSGNAKRLGKLDSVIAPLVETIAKDVLISPGGAAQLARLGFEFPLLLRAPGFHTGQHFARVENAEAFAEAARFLPGRELLVMQYLDAAGPDGLARKYRVMMVDGKFYPVHLAASRDWKVHYFTSEMSKRPELRAEEERFLTAMPEVLGARAMAGLSRIRDVLALDYAGIDFAVSRDGDVLLFEANATMTILPPDANPIWNYRRAAIARVLEAARHLVIERAGKASGA